MRIFMELEFKNVIEGVQYDGKNFNLYKKSYDYIFVEDINLQGLAQCLKLGKSTNDNSFGEFRALLNYKMYERGKIFYRVNKWEPTSQTCQSFSP